MSDLAIMRLLDRTGALGLEVIEGQAQFLSQQSALRELPSGP
jgi:hypothetical protein